jgi:hypothetical protein
MPHLPHTFVPQTRFCPVAGWGRLC